MQMEIGDPNPIQLLKKSYEKMNIDFLRICEEKDNIQSLLKYQSVRAEENLTIQKTHYENQVSNLTKKIQQLEDNCKKLQSEENEKNKKEFRNYVQAVNEKEVEINNLRRQISALKNKLAGQEQEVNGLNGTKENYQIFVFKTIQQIKSSVKVAYNYIEEMENEKMVMQSKFRQLNQKIILVETQMSQLDSKKNYLQESYQKLKSLYKGARQECLDLKYELQKVRQTGRQGRQSSILFQSKHDEQEETFLLKQLQSISQISVVLQDCESYLKQTNQFCEMNKRLVEDNNILKNRINELETEINQLKCRYISGHQDEYLKKKEPSLYDFLLGKKEQFYQLQKRIQTVQSYMEQKDASINKILEVILEKEQGCNCGKQCQLNQIKQDYQVLLKKNQILFQANQKTKRQCSGLQTKIDAYKEQIKSLITPKKGKNKKAVRPRCGQCLISIEKNQGSQKCTDCQKLYHENSCIRNHQCGAFVFQECPSLAQSEFN